MRKRIYICSPISKGDLLHNVRQADAAFFALLRAGLAPYNPVLCVFAGSASEEQFSASRTEVVAFADRLPCGTTHEVWIGADMPWVESAHALLRLPGESAGAEMEVAHALHHLIPVFATVEEVIAWATAPTR